MKGLRTDNSKICGKANMRKIGDTAKFAANIRQLEQISEQQLAAITYRSINFLESCCVA